MGTKNGDMGWLETLIEGGGPGDEDVGERAVALVLGETSEQPSQPQREGVGTQRDPLPLSALERLSAAAKNMMRAAAELDAVVTELRMGAKAGPPKQEVVEQAAPKVETLLPPDPERRARLAKKLSREELAAMEAMDQTKEGERADPMDVPEAEAGGRGAGTGVDLDFDFAGLA